MGELSNALQGKMNSRKGHVKDPSERQLDLFSSLSERLPPAPKIIPSKPGPRPELDMVLPPSPPPSDVSADVRAALSDSGPARPVDPSTVGGTGNPLPPTGIYHRPRRAPAPPPPPAPPPRAPSRPRISAMVRIREWFSGVELDRRLVALVAVLVVLVALIAFWTAGPRGGPETPGTTIDLAETSPAAEAIAPVVPASLPPVPAPVPSAAVPAVEWKIAGLVATKSGDSVLIRFSDPVFVSADRISVEGWAALKALAAKLAGMKSGARVVVTGYTDDVPLSKPTEQFRNNADLAAARAKTALEHLAQFARANQKLAFEAQTGDPAQAPYPNDSPSNRRLNRTVTVQVVPAP